jgi:multiple sugar transport system ATP-binding protein
MNFLDADFAQTGEQQAARGPGFEIPLALAHALRPARAGLDRIVVGIRPERISLEKRGNDVGLAGEVAMREVLGAEVVLHVDSKAGPLTVRTEANSAPRLGDTVQVWVDPSAVHVFDGATEVRL